MSEYELVTIPEKSTLAQIDQTSLKCFALLIAIEVEKSMQDPEFMKRFRVWKSERDAEVRS